MSLRGQPVKLKWYSNKMRTLDTHKIRLDTHAPSGTSNNKMRIGLQQGSWSAARCKLGGAALVATGRAGQCRRKQHREPGATGGKSGGIRKTEDAPAKNVGLGDL
jgi:hypothetical protein